MRYALKILSLFLNISSTFFLSAVRGWLARQKVKKMKLAQKQERIRQQQERIRLNKLKQQQQQKLQQQNQHQQHQNQKQQQQQQQQQQEYDSRQSNLVDNKVQENIEVTATGSSCRSADSSFGGQWQSALGRFSMACVQELIKEIHGGGPLTYPGIPYLETQDGLISRRRMPRVS